MSEKLIKLKSFKELRDTHKYDLEIKGSMVGISPKGKSSPTVFIPLDNLGEVVLLTKHTTLHPNILLYVPDLEQVTPNREE